MIEDALLNYGAMGIFVAYLVYDRQVVMKEVLGTMRAMTGAMQSCSGQLKELREQLKPLPPKTS